MADAAREDLLQAWREWLQKTAISPDGQKKILDFLADHTPTSTS